MGTLLDGEIVISHDNGAADFGALQARLSSSRNHRPGVPHERAAVLVAFDMLENAGASLVDAGVSGALLAGFALGSRELPVSAGACCGAASPFFSGVLPRMVFAWAASWPGVTHFWCFS